MPLSLIAQACLRVGDVETAELETEAARRSFADLGARPDLERLDAGKRTAAVSPDGLTPREIEVLRLVATGASNREVAEQLVLSERTVARHVANIFVRRSECRRGRRQRPTPTTTSWSETKGYIPICTVLPTPPPGPCRPTFLGSEPRRRNVSRGPRRAAIGAS